MNSIKVKICGIKRQTDVDICLQLGVDMLGFVVDYPLPVPWNMTRAEARPLLRTVQSPHLSCIVTGGPPEKVIELAGDLRPSFVQLHFMETLEDTITIANELQKLNIKVIKTVPPAKADRISQFGTENIEKIVGELCKTSVYGLLADSRMPANASKSGAKLDLAFCSQIIGLSSKPVIIAGGIVADNVCNLLNQTGARFIDIMTGVEKTPGEKDAALLANLLAAIQDFSHP